MLSNKRLYPEATLFWRKRFTQENVILQTNGMTKGNCMTGQMVNDMELTCLVAYKFTFFTLNPAMSFLQLLAMHMHRKAICVIKTRSCCSGGICVHLHLKVEKNLLAKETFPGTSSRHRQKHVLQKINL
jgi:hypothetical protein